MSKRKQTEPSSLFSDICKIHPQAVCAVTFEDVGPLMEMIEVMNGLLENCPMQILCSPEFTGVQFKCLDSSHTCAISAKLSASVLKSDKCTPEDMCICVPVALLSSHVKSVDNGSSVHMFVKEGSSNLMIKAVSPTNNMHFRTMSIKVMEWSTQNFDLATLTHDLTLQVDLRTLQKICKTAKLINCDYMRIRIFVDKKETNRSFFVVQSIGTGSADEHVFCSHTTKDDKNRTNMVIMMAEMDMTSDSNDPSKYQMSQLKETYTGVFPLGFISSFIRNLTQPIVLLRMSTKDPGPLAMTSMFGDEESYVSVLIGGKEINDLSDLIESFSS